MPLPVSLCAVLYLDAWTVKTVAGALAAIIDYEVEGHTIGMMEQGAGSSLKTKLMLHVSRLVYLREDKLLSYLSLC